MNRIPTTRKPTLDQAHIDHLNAETELFKVQSEHEEYNSQIQGLLAGKRKLEADLEGAKDWRNGYFLFSDEINSHSCGVFAEGLRMWSRMNPGKPIVINLNTPGGEIFSGFALVDELNLLRKQHHLTIRVRGQAASMGIVILQAADHREIGPSSHLMLHRTSSWIVGEAFKIEDMVDLTKMLEGRFVTILAERSGKPLKYFKDMFALRKDIWYSSEEALKHKLVDAIA